MSAFRQLYADVQDVGDSPEGVTRLLHAMSADAEVRTELTKLAPYHRPSRHSDQDNHLQALWSLYALSRVSDYLLLGFQGRSGEPTPQPAISDAMYVDFFQALGFRPFRADAYSPFFHEIVEVIEGDDQSEGVRIEHQFWPGLLFGDLMFARAGVRVRAHPSRIRKEYAESTLLCFSYWRHRRRAADRSLGWGSNSQWRTEFRRDYLAGDMLRFNVDGEVDIGGPEPLVLSGTDDFNDDISIALRRELLVNRCFVTEPYPWNNDEDWPSRDTLTVARTDPLVK
jgi:hypothetical protein